MSDKLIRDELLRSHRYQSLHSDTTKLVFVHILLSSDGLSNAEATATALSLLLRRDVSEEATATILAELADHDLVRLYESDGKRYAHIPRSRQRVRYLKGKHPRPPTEIEDWQIKELIRKVGPNADLGRTQDGPKTLAVAVGVAVNDAVKESSTLAPPAPSAPAERTKKPKADTRGSRLDEDFPFPDKWRDWAIECYPRLTPKEVMGIFIEFRNYWSDVPGQRGLKRAWFQTFQNRVHKRMENG